MTLHATQFVQSASEQKRQCWLIQVEKERLEENVCLYSYIILFSYKTQQFINIIA